MNSVSNSKQAEKSTDENRFDFLDEIITGGTPVVPIRSGPDAWYEQDTSLTAICQIWIPVRYWTGLIRWPWIFQLKVPVHLQIL